VAEKADESRAALDRALIELRPRLHRYCARMTGFAIDGEDLVQEVVVKAIDAFSRVPPIAHLEGWLFRIAHNSALNFLARRARQNTIFSDQDSSMIADPMTETDGHQTATASLRTFVRLPAAQRSSVILKDVLGYSLEEVVGIMGGSVDAIKANLHRGRARLREFAHEKDDAPMPVLHEPERTRLKSYVERFNARDFDAVRDMLAEDVRLDLVNAAQRKGRGGFDSYLGNYGKAHNWRLALGFADGRPALLVQDSENATGRPRNFILLEWAGDKVLGIRDFSHARYLMADVEIIVAE
jgi:RNA polymerase sigma-70 factor, ECF subfamily